HSLGKELRLKWRGPAKEVHPPMPGLVNFSHWFSVSRWCYLQSLMSSIMDLDCTNEERNFLLCVFSSIIRWVSNADDQTQKTYVSGTLKKSPPEVVPTFWRAYEKALGGLRELDRLQERRTRRIIQGDAANIGLPEASVDL